MDAMETVDRLGRAQHGLVTRAQVIGAGWSASGVRRRVAAGRLVVVRPGVYRLAGVPVTWEQRLLAAVLAAGPGAVASHRSAARLWGLMDDDAVEVTVLAGRRPRLPEAVVHRSGDLSQDPPVRRSGIPVTSPLRLLVDLGSVVRASVLEDVLDRALERRLVTVAGAERVLDRLAGRGRAGAGALRVVLDERALGADRPDSVLEARMARLLRAADLPTAVFQHDVRRGGAFVARVDFAYPDVRLAIEVDGWASHSSPRALQSDLARQNALVALGWTVLRFTWPDVVRRPGEVASQVARVLWTLRTA